jgi:nucleoside-diphosphate-sugar epimerase
MSKKVLVTGCAGFIGYNLSIEMLNEGTTVYGIDNLNNTYSTTLKKARIDNLNVKESFSFINIDLSDVDSVNAIEKNFDTVVHLAARAGVRQSFLNPEVYIRDNTLSTANISNYVKNTGIGKLILASTSSIYGDSGGNKVSEGIDELDSPPSVYAATKIAGENISKTILEDSETVISIPRFFTVYGPWGRPDMSILRFIYWIQSGESLRLYGNGEQKRAFTYVDDVVGALKKLIEKDVSGTFNIGSDNINTLNEVINLIEEKLDKTADINYLDRAYRDVDVVVPNLSKSKKELGWEPSTPLSKGIESTVNWCVEEFELLSKIDYLFEGEKKSDEN